MKKFNLVTVLSLFLQYCAVDSERGQLLHQTSEMENPERLCDLLLSNAKLCSSEHTDRDHCVRVS